MYLFAINNIIMRECLDYFFFAEVFAKFHKSKSLMSLFIRKHFSISSLDSAETRFY
jgi:hypothetical protein